MSSDSNRPFPPVPPPNLPAEPGEPPPKPGAAGGAFEDAYEAVDPNQHVEDYQPSRHGGNSKRGHSQGSGENKKENAPGAPKLNLGNSALLGPTVTGDSTANTNNALGSDLKSTTAREKDSHSDNKPANKGAKKTTQTTTKKAMEKTKKHSKKTPTAKPNTGKWMTIMIISIVIMVASLVGIAICAAHLGGIQFISAFEL